MEACKSLEDQWHKYSLYVHGYLLPWITQQREEGKLKLGKVFTSLNCSSYCLGNTIIINQDGFEHEYTGEIDSEQEACGWGTIVLAETPDLKYEGTFLNNQKHGYCKLYFLYLRNSLAMMYFKDNDYRSVFECRNDVKHGKETTYAK